MDDEMFEMMRTASRMQEVHSGIRSLVSLFDMSRLPYNMRLSVEPVATRAGSGFRVLLLSQSHDPFSGKLMDFAETIMYLDKVPTLTEFADAVRKTIHISMTHEMDELLFVNNEQRYNPHAIP